MKLDHEEILAIVVFVAGMALIGFFAYLKVQMFDGDMRCLVVECRINKE